MPQARKLDPARGRAAAELTDEELERKRQEALEAREQYAKEREKKEARSGPEEKPSSGRRSIQEMRSAQKLKDARTGKFANFDEGRVKHALKSIREHNERFEREGTTPRDLFEHQPDTWSAPDAVRPHIEVIFISDIMVQKRPMLQLFPWHIWEPVTPEVIENLGLVFRTVDRRPNGQPSYGMDMSAYWTTRKLYDEWKDTMSALFSPYDGEKTLQASVQSRFSDATLIGDDETFSGEGEVEEFGEEKYVEAMQGRRMNLGSLAINRPESMMTEEEIRAKRARGS